jgi:integrase/recombinase XerD
LVVREPKCGKSREVLLHTSALEALRCYADRRDRLCTRPLAPSFYVSTRGTRSLHTSAYPTFRSLVGEVDLGALPGPATPRVHRLRHYVDGGVMCPVGLLLQVGTAPVVFSGA